MSWERHNKFEQLLCMSVRDYAACASRTRIFLQARVAVLKSMLQAVNHELGLSLELARAPQEDVREQQFLHNISRCQAALQEHGRVARQTRAGQWIQRMRMQKRTLPSKYVSALDRTLPGWDKDRIRRTC
jgi:hypothetical protein